MTSLNRRCVLWLAAFLLAVTMGQRAASRAADELQVDDVMDRDPQISLPGVIEEFHPRLIDLWLSAMRRPESELQRLAADTITIAHAQGMPGLGAAAEDLAKLLKQSDSSVRRAAAKALVALDARQYAEALVELAREEGLDLQMVVEPAVARWGIDMLVESWQQRIAVATTPHLLRKLAIDGLGTLRFKQAQPALLDLVMNTRMPADERLAAAQALAAIGQGGMLNDARRLLADTSAAANMERVLGVVLVSAQQDAEAQTMLAALCDDPEPAVAGAAIGRLFELDPKLVFPLAPRAVLHPDVNVRRIGAKALAIQGDVAAIESLTPLLDDPNPGLRRLVCRSLFDLAQKAELRGAVAVAIEKTLKIESWRGLEQASLLAGHLDHKPVASRLIELLKHRRQEVAVSTAWALGRMKIPETLPLLLEHATAQHARRRNPNTTSFDHPVIDAQMLKLFQIFGDMRMMEADELLRKYVPKDLSLGESRIAACWALGKIHEGHEVSDLIAQFEERLADVASMPPEINPVRSMCALGLGRMNSRSSLEELRRFAAFGDHTAQACWWSIERLTGEKGPELTSGKRMVLGWFLQPVAEQPKPEAEK